MIYNIILKYISHTYIRCISRNSELLFWSRIYLLHEKLSYFYIYPSVRVNLFLFYVYWFQPTKTSWILPKDLVILWKLSLIANCFLISTYTCSCSTGLVLQTNLKQINWFYSMIDPCGRWSSRCCNASAYFDWFLACINLVLSFSSISTIDKWISSYIYKRMGKYINYSGMNLLRLLEKLNHKYIYSF